MPAAALLLPLLVVGSSTLMVTGLDTVALAALLVMTVVLSDFTSAFSILACGVSVRRRLLLCERCAMRLAERPAVLARQRCSTSIHALRRYMLHFIIILEGGLIVVASSARRTCPFTSCFAQVCNASAYATFRIVNHVKI